MSLVRELSHGSDFARWWALAHEALAQRLEPSTLLWRAASSSQSDLFAQSAACAAPAAGASTAASPSGGHALAEFRKLARRVICHRDPQRHAVLYRALWRLQHEPRLFDCIGDADVDRLLQWDREVSRAAHKMKAFLRFREAADGRFVAWFDPGHPLLEAIAPFFARRFASMRWLIVTPHASCAWDGRELHFGPGAQRALAAEADPCEALWQTYYAHIFNPARLKVAAMVREMPRRYWSALPEAPLIPRLVAAARSREGAMVAHAREVHAVRERAGACASLDELNASIAQCRACAAGCNGTRAVSGEGAGDARIMLVGEQPGDREEREGRPFVGPAGAVLDEALQRAGLARASVYLTNAVKHFSFRERGKQRLHKSPTRTIVEHCRWWVRREHELIAPDALVALGRTAGAALGVRATYHPAYLLREPDESRRAAAFEHLVAALVAARDAAAAASPAAASIVAPGQAREHRAAEDTWLPRARASA